MSHELSLQCFRDSEKDPEIKLDRYEDLSALLTYFDAFGEGNPTVQLPDRFPFEDTPPELVIVEDEASLSDILSQKLLLWGYPEDAIHFFADAHEAIAHFRNNPVGIALVDIKLTNPQAIQGAYTSGLEVVRELRATSPLAKVILMSGFSTYGMVRQAILDMGVSCFLRKPFKLADILGVVHWASEQICSGDSVQDGHDGERVLVVDDDVALAEGLASALRSFGYGAVVAEGGAQALDALGKYRFDAVLLDLKMPGVDGMEVLRHIRQADRQPIVLILSAVADQAIATKAISLGAYEFLLKPCDLNLLQFTLEHAFMQNAPDEA